MSRKEIELLLKCHCDFGHVADVKVQLQQSTGGLSSLAPGCHETVRVLQLPVDQLQVFKRHLFKRFCQCVGGRTALSDLKIIRILFTGT